MYVSGRGKFWYARPQTYIKAELSAIRTVQTEERDSVTYLLAFYNFETNPYVREMPSSTINKTMIAGMVALTWSQREWHILYHSTTLYERQYLSKIDAKPPEIVIHKDSGLTINAQGFYRR